MFSVVCGLRSISTEAAMSIVQFHAARRSDRDGRTEGRNAVGGVMNDNANKLVGRKVVVF